MGFLPVLVFDITVTPFWASWALIASLCHWLSQLSALASGPGEHWTRGLCPIWDCSSLWSCSRHSASFTCPLERAIDRGSRPRESGMEIARRSHLYSTTAASVWPKAQAHICKEKRMIMVQVPRCSKNSFVSVWAKFNEKFIFYTRQNIFMPCHA